MPKIATVFGGSGFLGRYIVQRLAKARWRVRVAVRHPNEANFVRPYGTPGQVEPIMANVRFDHSVASLAANTDAVINCVGILTQAPRQGFGAVHEQGAERIARLSAAAGVDRLVHVSAIGASESSESEYARTKALGERLVMEAFEGAVILRPSVMFGPEDRFFNMFATVARFSPVIPIVGGNTRFQPVYVDDVAAAAERAINDDSVNGILELGGPDIESFRELVERMLRVIRRRRMILDVPPFLMRPKAAFLDFLQLASGGLFANRFITRDQIRQLANDNVVGEGMPSLETLGIDRTSMDAILDRYLYSYRPAGQYTSIHESAEDLRSERSRTGART